MNERFSDDNETIKSLSIIISSSANFGEGGCIKIWFPRVSKASLKTQTKPTDSSFKLSFKNKCFTRRHLRVGWK